MKIEWGGYPILLAIQILARPNKKDKIYQMYQYLQDVISGITYRTIVKKTFTM